MLGRYTVIGDPIEHSLSPVIHKKFAEQFGQTIEYEKTHVPGDKLAHFVSQFSQEGGQGFNVTLPHKEKVITHIDELTPRARKVGAVNVVKITEKGRTLGDNVDGIGFMADLNAWPFSVVNQKVAVLGAGGAVRGVIQALLSAGCQHISIYNRTREKAKALIDEMASERVQLCEFNELENLGFDLLINGISRVPPQSLLSLLEGRCAHAYDLNYGERSDGFQQWASTQGMKSLDGLGMLVEQAAASFQWWTGYSPNTQADNWHQLLGVQASA